MRGKNTLQIIITQFSAPRSPSEHNSIDLSQSLSLVLTTTFTTISDFSFAIEFHTLP